MPPRVLLDTCVLYPQSLRGVLLQLAEREFFLPLWSDRILEELKRNLVPQTMRPASFASLVQAFDDCWPEARVTGWERLESQMANDEGDRHVLAAAVRGKADLLVTSNLRHFPEAACADLGVEVLHPDDFLMRMHEEHEWGVLHAITKFAFELRRPRLTTHDVATALVKQGCAAFGQTILAQLASLPAGGPARWYPGEVEPPDPSAPGWFCIRTNPFPCGDGDCDFVTVFMTAAHRIVLWPTHDDPSLLSQAADARRHHRNPQVVPYSAEMGPACSYYEFNATGSLVYGVQPGAPEDDVPAAV